MKSFWVNNRSRLKSAWSNAFTDTLIGQSIVVLLVLLLAAFLWARFSEPPDFGDLQVEFWGLIFDVAVILVGFGIIQHYKQKRDDISRHSEVIEDLKRWDSDEAKHRVLGAMRRLNRLGKTDFELSGAHLKNASFTDYGIKSISGSTLSSGGRWLDDEITSSIFEQVDFSRLNARNVRFESTFPMRSGTEFIWYRARATYKDCEFWGADLHGTVFDGAELIWTREPPESLEEFEGEQPDGSPSYIRVAVGHFERVDLARTSFRYCSFERADFRESENIEAADFTGAQGLESCAFDNEGLKETIIQKSKDVKS